MEIKNLKVLLWEDGGEEHTGEYTRFVTADLRSCIRGVEIPEANNSNDIVLPPGNVIESVHLEGDELVVRGGPYTPDEDSRKVIAIDKVPAAVALAEAIFVKEVEGKQRIFLNNPVDNSGNLLLYECEDKQAAESHRCAIVDYLLRALEKSCY